jgi:hypothetical protein
MATSEVIAGVSAAQAANALVASISFPPKPVVAKRFYKSRFIWEIPNHKYQMIIYP